MKVVCAQVEQTAYPVCLNDICRQLTHVTHRKHRFGLNPTGALMIKCLVLCEQLIMAGGLMRFVRLQRVMAEQGGELVFCVLGDNKQQPLADLYKNIHAINFNDACEQQWDYTFVPGAGFSPSVIESFAKFHKPFFGQRVQHVLNDRSIEKGFLAVNKSFKPHHVVFNNRHWLPGDFTRFHARRFSFVEGAVDTQFFTPRLLRSSLITNHRKNSCFVLGALANKNITLILDTFLQLTNSFHLVLIGSLDIDLAIVKRAMETKRVVNLGVIDDDLLRDFYRDIDLFIHAEYFAGWANPVAEAMACGVPVVCSRHGTLAFAEHKKTAWVMPEVTQQCILEGIEYVTTSPEELKKQVALARQRIEPMTWKAYAKELFDVLQDDGYFHYTWSPRLGLYGKWPLSIRLKGLDRVFERVGGKTVIDLGCAEGVVSYECLKAGAKYIHGFEYDVSRVKMSKHVCNDYSNVDFWQADLASWPIFTEQHKDVLLKSYDVVLFLGLQHHLPYPERLETVKQLASLASEWFVIRTPETVFQHDRLDILFSELGLQEVYIDFGSSELGGGGNLRIFKKRPIRQRHFVSYPKSGRSWLRYLFTELGISEHILFHHDQFEFNDGTLPPHNFDITKRLEKYSKEDKIVYLHRDPRDIMVSLYYQVTGRFKDFFGYNGSISDFIRDPYFGAENLSRFRKMWEQLSHERDVLTISYEDCHENIERVCLSVLDFYNLPADKDILKNAIEAARFENMKAVEQSQSYREPWLRPRNDAPKVRRGIVGGFRDEMPQDDIDYLSEIFALK